jgi:putative flavoprotein involved in K+ transport
MCRLPGWRYDGPDRDGFMAVGELVRHLEAYAGGAPVEEGRAVHEVTASGDGFAVVTEGRSWQARQVVVATGPTGRPAVPAGLAGLDPEVEVISPLRYRRPDTLRPGGVLVVGASSSGVQIAEELALAGRRVVLAVGRHTRMPRRYRGVDAYWWLERTGRLSRTIETMADATAARREPSYQVVGRAPGDPRTADLDLLALQSLGVELVGRLHEADGRRLRFAGPDELQATVATADRRMHRFLDIADRCLHVDVLRDRIDEWPVTPAAPATRPRPVRVGRTRTLVDLRAEGITTVVLATGYRPHHPWLKLPVRHADGALRQVRGATTVPGLYVVGQRFQHRRDAATIDGARHTARDVVTQLCAGQAPVQRMTDLEAAG